MDGAAWGAQAPCQEPLGPQTLHLQLSKLRVCLSFVRSAEAEREQRFHWVARLRPDAVWFAPVGDLARLDPGAVHVPCFYHSNYWIGARSCIGDPSDSFALVPRAHAEAYFDMRCPTLEQWAAGSCTWKWRAPSGVKALAAECALKMQLDRLGVPFVAFPTLFDLVRPTECLPGDSKCGEGWQELWATNT